MDKILDLLGASSQWVLLVTLLVGVVKAILKYLPELEPAFAKSAAATAKVKKYEARVSFIFSALLVVALALVIAPQNLWLTAVAGVGIFLILAIYKPLLRYAERNPDPSVSPQVPSSPVSAPPPTPLTDNGSVAAPPA